MGGSRRVRPRVAVIVFSLAAATSLIAPPNARAATWRTVSLPNVTDHPDSGMQQGMQPPYRLDWVDEGRSNTGEQDPGCPVDPPYANGERIRTGEPDTDHRLHGVLGIWKRGPFVRVGDPTPGANHGGNHLAVFFHTADLDGTPCFRGSHEYGLTRKLAEGSTKAGDQPLDFYQCANCNCKPNCGDGHGGTVTEQYTVKAIGWMNSQEDKIYRVSFARFTMSSFGVSCSVADANFLVQVVDPVSWKTLLSVRICRASWFPDLKGASGWITANSHTDTWTSDGVDHFDGSYNQVTAVKWLGS